MKYRVLIDYGSEGWKFEDEEFDDLTKAVLHATARSYSAPFHIVTIVQWKAELI